jgi:signal transduction histidine kinase
MNELGLVVERFRRMPPVVVDMAIAAAIVLIESSQAWPPASHPPELGLLVLGAVGVTLRRKNPWIAFLIVQVAAIVGLVAHVPFVLSYGGYLEEYVVLYTVAERRGAAESALALVPVFSLLCVAWHEVRSGLDQAVSEQLFLLAVYPDCVWAGLAWFAGRAQRRRRRIARGLEQSSAALRAERDRVSQAAVVAERARIARDLHAVVIRGIEKMVLLDQSADIALGRNDPEALEAIMALETRGRETLVQMRRLLSVLRAGPSGAPASGAAASTDA